MKFTRKYQQGGSLFSTYAPVLIGNKVASKQGATSTKTSGKTSSNTVEQSSLLDDELYKEMIKMSGDVLVNEGNAWAQELIQLEQQSKYPYLNRDSQAQSLKIINKFNQLKQNKELWKDAYTQAKSTGGIGEIAIGSSGEVFIKTSNGDLRSVSLTDYEKYKSKYRALTVSELLTERQYNPDLVGDTKIFAIANNSVGIENISNYIRTIVSSLGSESFLSTSIHSRMAAKQVIDELSSGSRAPTQAEIAGFQDLQIAANSPDEFIEITRKSESKRNNAEKAVKYIWSTLSKPAQNKLRAQAIENGLDNPIDIITNLILSGDIYSEVVKATDSSKDKTGSTSSSGMGQMQDLNPVQQFFATNPDQARSYVFNDTDIRSKLGATMTSVATFTDPEGNAYAPTNLNKALFKGWQNIVDIQNITFGENKVSPHNLEDIAITGSEDMAHVFLPANEDGSVNMDALDDFNTAKQEYDKYKNEYSVAQLENIFLQKGFRVSINPNTKEIEWTKSASKVKPFLLTFGYTRSGSALIEGNTTEETGGLSQVKGNDLKAVEDIISEAYSERTERTKQKYKDIGPDKWFGKHYKGAIFIPLRETYISLLDGHVDKGPRKQPYTMEQVNRNLQTTSGQFSTDNITIDNMQ